MAKYDNTFASAKIKKDNVVRNWAIAFSVAFVGLCTIFIYWGGGDLAAVAALIVIVGLVALVAAAVYFISNLMK